MSAGGSMPRHGIASLRTTFIAVTGFGSAALFTSVAALHVGADDLMIAVSIVGGTTVLGVAAMVTLLVARRMTDSAESRLWTLAGSGLILTAVASGVRAGDLLLGYDTLSPGLAEAAYIAGQLLVLAAILGYPLQHRRQLKMGVVALEAGIVSAALLAISWRAAGSWVVEAAGSPTSIGVTPMAAFFAYLALLFGSAVFSIAAAVNLRASGPILHRAFLSFALILIVIGDAAWLVRTSAAGWALGSLSDFAHVSGHVLVAVAASLALDIERELVRRATRPAA